MKIVGGLIFGSIVAIIVYFVVGLGIYLNTIFTVRTDFFYDFAYYARITISIIAGICTAVSVALDEKPW